MTISKPLPAIIALPLTALLAASTAQTEADDYSWWQTLANLVSPPKADN